MCGVIWCIEFVFCFFVGYRNSGVVVFFNWFGIGWSDVKYYYYDVGIFFCLLMWSVGYVDVLWFYSGVGDGWDCECVIGVVDWLVWNFGVRWYFVFDVVFWFVVCVVGIFLLVGMLLIIVSCCCLDG